MRNGTPKNPLTRSQFSGKLLSLLGVLLYVVSTMHSGSAFRVILSWFGVLFIAAGLEIVWFGSSGVTSSNLLHPSFNSR